MEKILALISFISVVISIIALFYSKKAWHKSRAVYKVEREVIEQLDAYDSAFNKKGTNENDLNKKLSNGNYSILTVLKGKGLNEWEVLLGRITPYRKNKLSKKVKERCEYLKFVIKHKRF